MSRGASPEDQAYGAIQRAFAQNNLRPPGQKWPASRVINAATRSYASAIATADNLPMVQTAIGDNGLGNNFLTPALNLANQITSKTIKYSVNIPLTQRTARGLLNKFIQATRPAPTSVAGAAIVTGSIAVGQEILSNMTDYQAMVESIYNQVVAS